MARRSHGDGFAQCIKSDGVVQAFSGTELGGPGCYTLASGTTYYFPLNAFESADKLAVHLIHDASIVITSATIEDSNLPPPTAIDGATVGVQTSWFESSAAGRWIDEDPSTAFVGTKGAATSATNGVVAVTGGTAGGAMWHFVDAASRRARLAVVVGGTGGEVIVACWAKE